MEEMTSCAVVGPSKMKTKQLRNPFLMKISDSSLHCDNYEKGVELMIVCEASFWVFSFWCVDIASFHQKINGMDWSTLKNSLLDEGFKENALYSNDLDLYRDQYKSLTHKVTPPPESALKSIREYAVSSNRSKYPLVILLVLNDNEIEHTIEGDDIVLLVSVVHLKDNIIPLDTSVIASYIKRKCGTVLNLHDLFISSEIEQDHGPTCVICLTNDVTHALLPCRHTCLCGECFPQILQCPICRSPVQSCIALDQAEPPSKQIEQNLPSNPVKNERPVPQRTESFWRRCKRTLFG